MTVTKTFMATTSTHTYRRQFKLVPLIVGLQFAASVSAHSVDRVQPPRAILETHIAKLHGGTVITVVVDGVDAGDGFYEDTVAEISDHGEPLQRISLSEYLNWSPRRGELIVRVADVDKDGNDDLFIVVDAAVHNTTMRLFRYAPRLKQFLQDRDFVNPMLDPKTRCVIEHINNGGVSWRGILAVVCRKGNQWVKRFYRTQGDVKRLGVYAVQQTDYTTSPPRTTQFDLTNDGNNQDAWSQGLPAWVAQMRARATQLAQRHVAR